MGAHGVVKFSLASMRPLQMQRSGGCRRLEYVGLGFQPITDAHGSMGKPHTGDAWRHSTT